MSWSTMSSRRPSCRSRSTYGADVVVYSGTKHMDGQGRVLGGAILSTRKFKEELLKPFLRHTGPSISPFNAWVLLKGLETLKLRVMAAMRGRAGDRTSARGGARRIARASIPISTAIRRPLLPAGRCRRGGTMVTFEVDGGKAQAFDVLRRLELIDISNNLGDAKSLITHPASTTHRNIGPEARAPDGHHRRHAAGCRWASRISRTCSATSPTPWRIGGRDVSDALELHAKLKSKMPPLQ